MLCCQGNVESWLVDLLKVTRLTVHSIISCASTAITDANFKLLDFEKVFPAQVFHLSVIVCRQTDRQTALTAV